MDSSPNSLSKTGRSADPEPAPDAAPKPPDASLDEQLSMLGLDERVLEERLRLGRTAAECLEKLGAPREAIRMAFVAPCSNLNGFSLERLVPAASDDERVIIDGVERLARVRWDRIDETAAETLRNTFLSMARDVRVVLVALALRVATMSHLEASSLEPKEKLRIARETLDVFAPLANRLGIWQLKWRLEDAALSILDPDSYGTISALLNERQEQRDQFITQVTSVLGERLSRDGISATLSGRSKHIYSIYNKMRQKQVSFDELYDISAVRVVTERLSDCYAVLGVVHELWKPIPGEFDDYIAMPKSNGYQSLHTAVLGPGGRPVEVQIRTQEMHRFAELGVAAHWAYKEHRQPSSAENDRLLLFRRVLDWEQELSEPGQFVESLKTNLLEDEVFVFTPEGDVIDLPKGATPVDFAYRVHTMVGHRCRGARVNGQMVPLDRKLETGDRVEILTQKLPKPNRDWMNPALGFTVTASARAKVRHWFRQAGRDSAIAEGREAIHKELQRADLKGVSLERIATKLEFDDVDELNAAVGYGLRKVQSVVAAALELDRATHRPSEAKLALPARESPEAVPRRASAGGLSVDGIDNVLARPGACCKPVPGDDVVGFVTRGRGVVIHRRDCAQLQSSSEPQRIVDVAWHAHSEERHPIAIELRGSDAPHQLADITAKLTSFGVTVTKSERAAHSDGSASLRFTVECRDSEQLAHVLSRLAREPDITSVRRASS